MSANREQTKAAATVPWATDTEVRTVLAAFLLLAGDCAGLAVVAAAIVVPAAIVVVGKGTAVAVTARRVVVGGTGVVAPAVAMATVVLASSTTGANVVPSVAATVGAGDGDGIGGGSVRAVLWVVEAVGLVVTPAPLNCAACGQLLLAYVIKNMLLFKQVGESIGSQIPG